MKKLFILLTMLASVAFLNDLNAQTITMPLDSVKSMLCKKWDLDYTIVDKEKLKPMPGAPVMNYEFQKDATLLLTVAGTTDALHGTWIYDAAKKLIRVSVNQQNRITITSLKQNELVMQIDMKDVTPGDPTPGIFVYRPRAN